MTLELILELFGPAIVGALLAGRAFVTPDDVVRVLHSVVCHRLILAPEVELDGMSAAQVMDRIASTVEVPR